MSNSKKYKNCPVSSSQQGAVLIVVLLFLVLIISVGVIAVRQSTTDLRLSTSDQINTLLLQSADNSNQNIEQSINGRTDADIYKQMLSIVGPFGYFISEESNGIDNEYIFCFRPRSQFFNADRTTIETPEGNTVFSGEDGYCNPASAEDYISNRNASMTQISVLLTPPSPDDETFPQYTKEGGDTNEKINKSHTFDISSTAVLPAYADTNIGSKNCFEQTNRIIDANDPTDTIGGCMAEAGVPNTILYQQAQVEKRVITTNCVDYGVGTGVICTLPAS